MSSTRTFEVVDIAAPGQKYAKKGSVANRDGGRYVGKTAQQAAKKAFSKACQKSKSGKSKRKIKGRCTFAVTMRETTRGSDHKLSGYRFTRKLKKKPDKVKLKDGTEIVFKYNTEVKSLDVNTPSDKSSLKRRRPKKVKPTELYKLLS